MFTFKLWLPVHHLPSISLIIVTYLFKQKNLVVRRPRIDSGIFREWAFWQWSFATSSADMFFLRVSVQTLWLVEAETLHSLFTLSLMTANSAVVKIYKQNVLVSTAFHSSLWQSQGTNSTPSFFKFFLYTICPELRNIFIVIIYFGCTSDIVHVQVNANRKTKTWLMGLIWNTYRSEIYYKTGKQYSIFCVYVCVCLIRISFVVIFCRVWPGKDSCR